MIAIRDIAYVRYQVPDLNAQAAFLSDFGLLHHAQTATSLHMATYAGGYPAYIAEQGPNKALGVGYRVASLEDLQRVAAHFDVPVLANEELGAGWSVTLRDPDGSRVDLLFGGDVIRPLPVRAALQLNTADKRQRVGTTNRVQVRASHVVRLGHVVLKTVDYRAMFAFYHDLLGLRVSDSYFAESPENTVAAFMHCGLGEHYTDHHTVALLNLGALEPGFDHCAFEVVDWDDLATGSQHLAQLQHRHSWGIGRHVQGSQVFDYWLDPNGNKIEHWTDGDLVNDATPVTHEPLSPDALSQWAPPLNPEFLA
ncbi:VOC family protein [Pseudomonas vancouverensis]|uniref:Glyoxalase n=1 Tax=Pseudomonas vancouverensis TaxID=95300 RepID=A0A1H2NMZ7_PSEVA|nr:VOC family protein [Pseudomonas vancouverensis]KAB0495312.1 glyoxalase [Pseudomonas vancouverensis]TDB56927.1 glyoxalase [Pseudomonas vancouverensis]SDV06708.1 Catechol 2,3-dioxygenase [Pseudomonas vancouverensis]